MHVYSQMSTRTTLPRSASAVSGGEFTQRSTLNAGNPTAAAAEVEPRSVSRITTTAKAEAALPQRLERRTQLPGQQLRLFPGGEMAALLGAAVVNELGVGPLRPAPRRLI